jgi:hypothetical protein
MKIKSSRKQVESESSGLRAHTLTLRSASLLAIQMATRVGNSIIPPQSAQSSQNALISTNDHLSWPLSLPLVFLQSHTSHLIYLVMPMMMRKFLLQRCHLLRGTWMTRTPRSQHLFRLHSFHQLHQLLRHQHLPEHPVQSVLGLECLRGIVSRLVNGGH